MHGKQSSDEKSYLSSRKASNRRIKSLRNVYKETKVRVACYFTMSDCPWMRLTWAREVANEYCSVRREAEEVMKEIGHTLILGEDGIKLNGEQLFGTWKEV